MAEREDEWVSDDGEIDVSADGKTMSGHSFSATAFGPYTCETRLETAAVREFEWDLETSEIYLDGEQVELSSLPEQDRTEIEVALKKAALDWVKGYLTDAWMNGQDPVPPNAMTDWG